MEKKKSSRNRKSGGNDCNFCANHLEPGKPPVKLKRHMKNCEFRKEVHIIGCDKCMITKQESSQRTKRTQDWRKDNLKSSEQDKNPSGTIQEESINHEPNLSTDLDDGSAASSKSSWRVKSKDNKEFSNEDSNSHFPSLTTSLTTESNYNATNASLLINQQVEEKISVHTNPSNKICDSLSDYDYFDASMPSLGSLLNDLTEVAFSPSTDDFFNNSEIIMQVEVPKDSNQLSLMENINLEQNMAGSNNGDQANEKEIQLRKSNMAALKAKRNKKCLNLFVRKDGGPELALTTDQVRIYKEKFEDMIDQIPSESKMIPKFFYSGWRGGYWQVKCYNEYSKRWFRRKITTITCGGDGPNTQFRVFSKKILPRFEAEIYISKRNENDSNATILNRFDKQNDDLNITLWKIPERKCVKNESCEELKLRVGIDLDSLEKMKMKGFKLFYRMDSVRFTLHDKFSVK